MDSLGLESTHANVAYRPGGRDPVPSLPFDDGDALLPGAGEPAFFRDLNLHQVVDSIVGRQDEYDLRRLFHQPLPRACAVEYRHEVFRDLESDALRSVVQAFADEARRVRRFVAMAEGQHFELEKQRWLLDAAAVYCTAVQALVDALSSLAPRSRGFLSVRASSAV
jgi:DNA mismatch repair protein MutS